MSSRQEAKSNVRPQTFSCPLFKNDSRSRLIKKDFSPPSGNPLFASFPQRLPDRF
uniref:Uncharacterized protein n=1 Tax=Leptospirillum sp. Group II '5-way CG' TaxID=419541 RepID=B6AL62_9BACT|nr:MAG: Hypothetical protein CGL2_11346097 [Leptospirillum sp. Group II '5-way CG']